MKNKHILPLQPTRVVKNTMSDLKVGESKPPTLKWHAFIGHQNYRQCCDQQHCLVTSSCGQVYYLIADGFCCLFIHSHFAALFVSVIDSFIVAAKPKRQPLQMQQLAIVYNYRCSFRFAPCINKGNGNWGSLSIPFMLSRFRLDSFLLSTVLLLPPNRNDNPTKPKQFY